MMKRRQSKKGSAKKEQGIDLQERQRFFKGKSDRGTEEEAKKEVREGGIDSGTEEDEEQMSDLAECCISPC